MGLYAAGQVVFLKFTFSDLSNSKLRPVVLLAYTGQNEWLSCQITSNPYIDPARDSDHRFELLHRRIATR